MRGGYLEWKDNLPDVDASTSESGALEDGDLCTVGSSSSCGCQTSRASTDDQKVVKNHFAILNVFKGKGRR